MKKILLILTTIAIFFNMAKAQINMTSNGYVMIGGTSTPYAPLHVNGCVYIPGTAAGNSYWINSTSDAGIRLRMLVNTGYGAFIDFYPCLWFRTDANAGVTQTPLYIKSSNGYVGMNTTNPQYQLDVNGVIRVQTTTYTSDARLKLNIKNLNNSPVDSVFLLQGVTYNLKLPSNKKTVAAKFLATSKPDSSKSTTDTIGKSTSIVSVDSALYNRRHIGFIAQDVQKIFPDLVYTDKNGILSIDYISIIPLLLEALKQQQAQINNLTQQVNNKNSNSLKSDKVNTGIENTIDQTNVPYLQQNKPNPFSQSTNIGYYLPETVQNATLYVYNMNGVQIKSIPITSKGNGSITINGYELSPGMYLYTLIADDKEVVTKRMILTQ